MNIIYIHGLDSDANSTKGVLLEKYCQQYHPDISVYRPDLNSAPEQVFEQLVKLVTQLSRDAETVLIGSSLGGYFSTLVSNHTGCAALLLNPSTQPHITLQRFTSESSSTASAESKTLDNEILYTTVGGWHITHADLQWFAAHPLGSINYPDKMAVFIKEGDELLNPYLSRDFYRGLDARVTLQEGGDHRFSDFDVQLPIVIDTLQRLLQH
ncbi:YqiA/YcfP family alpha/beta fold hydrolase [Psychrobacter sp. SWN149]|uniref:YqiA/YcfP family alpha/beta fold hydrolase n=1 Tax=Psychrobacter sp. SWN149 TaxID=2792057 RepID=UPI0018CDBD8B|nr:YqiA/YcfP family alpha/beta fold hydrolase [Psychrobacter sp. SWN149]MBH0007163.1 hypothetical protein [Psychrobacter sp. SWN149]